jgi:hypothetical protein
MPTLVLRENISTLQAPGSLARRPIETERDRSLAGIVIFSGIGFGLAILAAIFQWLQLPPPFF